MKHFSALNHSMSFPSFTYFVLYFNLRLRENIVYAVNLLSKSKVELSLYKPLYPILVTESGIYEIDSLQWWDAFLIYYQLQLFFSKIEKDDTWFSPRGYFLEKIKMKTRYQFHCTFYSAGYCKIFDFINCVTSGHI